MVRVEISRKELSKIKKRNPYHVDSEVAEGLMYIIGKTKFALVRDNDLAFWELFETKEASKEFVPVIRDEIIKIFEDIQFLANSGMPYVVS